MPSVRSIAVGCWVDTGTRDELTSEAGASHFLEHLLFKGSERYSARYHRRDLRRHRRRVECVHFERQHLLLGPAARSRPPDRARPAGRDVAAPCLSPNEIDSERQVVIEEINMNDDDPSDVAFEEFTQAVFCRSPARDARCSAPAHRSGHEPRSTSTATGSGDMEPARRSWRWRDRSSTRTPSTWSASSSAIGRAPVDHELQTGPHLTRDGPRLDIGKPNRPTSSIGGLGLNRADERRFAFDILNHILGGGMSSRLFLKIREERGLAYAIYSFRMAHADTGGWGVYVGTTPDQAETCLQLIDDELAAVVEDGITAEELGARQGLDARRSGACRWRTPTAA